MIAVKAAGKPYVDLVRELILEPQGLHSTFYTPGTYPPEVIARLAHGYFENTACAEYQPPDCKETWNAPLVGQDVREDSTSWAQAAAAYPSSRRILRMRAIFKGRLDATEQGRWTDCTYKTRDDPSQSTNGTTRRTSPGNSHSLRKNLLLTQCSPLLQKYQKVSSRIERSLSYFC